MINMTRPVTIFAGADIHDGTTLHTGRALALMADGTAQIIDTPTDGPVQTLTGGTITPGFVDLQVNGGGGVMFNDDQSVETLRTIAAAHARSGTSALLPTLITDTPARTQAAIDAVEQAIAQNIPGIIGIHLEGPHLSVARKGAHDATLIRPMDAADLNLLLDAKSRLPHVMVTVAPENVTNTQITTLADAGIIVSLGHTDAGFDACMAAFDAGARCATHLFNAMSQLANRDPGLVGAALARDDVFAGIIADGIHVHPQTMRAALAAKSGDNIFLVTDAMATAGSQITQFTLNGRTIHRNDHRLTLGDGTLAGADLEMPRAISVLHGETGQSRARAIARAISVPASLLGDATLGRLDGAKGPFVYLGPDGSPCQFLTAQGLVRA